MRAASIVVLLLACSEDAPAGLEVETSEVDEVHEVDVEAEVDAEAEVALQGPAALTERGFREVRLIAHLHSAFSHDACDELGLDAEGKPNVECVRRLKQALCQERIGHVFMTDHPGNARDAAWEALFYADPPADDELLLHDGVPWAVRFACAEGEGGPDGRVTLMVGYEGTHTMPLGLRRPMDWERNVAFVDETPTDDLVALTAAVAASGGKLAIAHSEESDLSAATIAAHDVAAMELYNFHANFNEVLGEGLGDALFELDRFLGQAADTPDGNLAALILFGSYPEAALEKWRAVSAVRPITAFAGADAHENVTFPAFCQDMVVCEGLVADYPNLVEYLKTGGPVPLSDGERLDWYARVFRWVHNRVYVASADAASPEAVEAAFLAGRSVVVFEVLGTADGVAFIAESADGALHDLGETVPRTGMTLWARSPELPSPPPYMRWSDGSAAVMESIVWHTDATGTTEVARWSTPGTWQQVVVEKAGAYQLEVVLTPKHLASELGPAAHLADAPYRWVETNAIRFVD